MGEPATDRSAHAPRHMAGEPPDLPTPPAAATDVFRGRLRLACNYVTALADTGVRHGLIGPREVPRVWERHMLNCAVLQELIPEAAVVADVGSGAGLPGVPLAIARPDVQVILVEPLLRRTRWLHTVVSEVGLSNVAVRRARAEALAGTLAVDVVTARAVSRLATLAVWCSPLLRPEGLFLAVKGSTAAEELAADAGALADAGLVGAAVVQVGSGLVEPPTTVVTAVKAAGAASARGRSRSGRRSR